MTDAPSRQARKRVLVVDDERAGLVLSSIILTRAGYEVTTAAEGATALRMCLVDRTPFDAVVLDIGMPRMSGLEVVAKLRSDLATRRLPIICCSARATPRERSEGMDAGCDAYLIKPIAQADLLMELEKALGSGKHGSHG